MRTVAKPSTKWLLSLIFALIVISLILVPQVLKVESRADYAREGIAEGNTVIHISTGGQLAQLIVRTQKDKCTWKGKTIVLDNDISMRSVTTQPTLNTTSGSFGQCSDSGSFVRPEYNNSDNGNKGRIDDSWNYCVTFEGIFDGQGHTISGLYTYKNSGGDGKWNGLLFDRLSGTVKNIRFTDCTIEYDHPKENSDSALGLIGGVTSGGLVENVYVDSTVTYISHRTATGNYLRTIGGIAGWVDGGTLRNCVAFPTVISANGQGSLNYPFNGTARITIGGVTGAIESTSTVVNCIGGGTFYSNVPSRSFMGVTESYSNPGWNLACPSYLGNMGDKTIENVYGGKQASAPDGTTGWKDFTFDMGTFVPADFGFTQSIDDYDSDMRHWGTTVTVSSWSDFTSMISKVNANTQKGQGTIFKLTADIAQFGDKTFYSRSTWASGAAVTIPAYPAESNFVRFANFKGVLDGDGHVLSGVFARRVAYNSAHEGGLFMEFGGCLKNLAITNTFFCGDHTKNGSGTTYTNAEGLIYGGLAGKGNGRIENCYFDYDCFLINNYAAAGYGYLFGQLNGALTVSNVTCAGRFWVCNTSLQNTIATTGGSACGVIAGNGNNYAVTVNNFVFSGPRSTYIAGSGSTNDVAFLVHWSNTNCSFTGTNFYGKTNGSAGNTEGKTPTADGTNYAFVSRFAEVGIKKNAETFSGNFKLPLYAQTATGKLRLMAKITKTAVNSNNVSEIGFRLTRNDTGESATLKLNSVYTGVTVGSEVKNAYEIMGKGEYLFGFTLTSIPAGIALTVEPYIKFGDTTYYGASADYPANTSDVIFKNDSKTIDLYLVAGQSNAVGYTSISDRSAAYAWAPELENGFSNVLFAGATRWHSDGTVVYNDSYNWGKTKLGFGVGNDGDKIGPEAGMAKALAEVYNTTGGKVAGIFKYGHGGTSLLQRSWSTMAASDSNKYGTWVSPTYASKKFGISSSTYYAGEDRTGELYREFLTMLETKLRYLTTLGYTNVNIKGLYWMQGENDRTKPDDYKVAFQYFASDIRRDVAALVSKLTGGDDRGAANMPILVGLISETQNLNSADAQATNQAFIAMQRTLPSVVENCYIVDNSQYQITAYNSSNPSSPTIIGSDQWHWNQADALAIGYNVGKTFFAID